jgi:hypothetical protein
MTTDAQTGGLKAPFKAKAGDRRTGSPSQMAQKGRIAQTSTLKKEIGLNQKDKIFPDYGEKRENNAGQSTLCGFA